MSRGHFVLLAPLPALFALAVLAACTEPADDGTSCGRAKSALAECGVMMPFDLAETCAGTTEAISECVVAAGPSCEALAELGRHLDRCTARDASSPVPDDFPAVNAMDASRDAGRDGAPFAWEDAGVPPSDGAVDAASVADASGEIVLDVGGTVSAGQALAYETPRVGTGAYSVTFTASGSVDVYVRKGFAPTTTTWDCKTSSPSTPCVVNVASSAILHVLVRGSTSASTFRIVVTEGSP